ncbi:MAG: 3-deoxy-manno-octulosonate cytidylyltransferase [Verrucomicrobiota bacterium]
MKTLIVVPARWGSTRFPGKMLAPLLGKPLVQWAWEAAGRSRLADRVVVATDDRRIRRAVEAFGGEVVMTSKRHPSGTDRMAEVAEKVPARLYVNVQGDEALLPPREIDALIRGMAACRAPIGTLAHAVASEEEYQRPDVVKVVTDREGNALYFSRSPLPCFRDGLGPRELRQVRRHVGIYAYRAAGLRRFVSLPPGRLEKYERLEQLRALEHGLRIRVFATRYRAVGVDTPADLAEAEQLLRARG